MKKIVLLTLSLFYPYWVFCQQAKAADPFNYLDSVKRELSLAWPDNKTVNIVYHGHSVPAGYWHNHEVHTFQSYPMILLKKIKEKYPYAVVNSIVTAIGGENSVSGRKRFEQDVLTHKPDVLIIDYALNDIGRELPVVKQAWSDMIVQALSRNIKVILLTPSPDQRINILSSNNKLELHARQIRELARKYHVGLADPFKLFQKLVADGKNLADVMSHVNHPNLKGHEIIANELFKWFDPENTASVFPQLGKNPVKEVIGTLTTEQKSLLVTGAKRRGVIPLPLPGRKQKDITGVGGYTYPFVKLGIPSIMLSDGPAGLRIAPKRLNDPGTYYCTAFPVATVMASTWNTPLIRELGSAIGKEALEYGVDIILAPGMNIQRDPLGGRNFEYFSEDPVVTGKMAAAVVNGIQSQGVGASIKHFAVNNQETNRRAIDAVVSERALREIYLQGFRIAVKESNPWTVMSSYNKINGVYSSENKELLDVILRKEWGFKGFVLTDWYAGSDPVAQLKAGNDLLMPGLAVWSQKIDSALSSKSLDAKTIEQNIERILNVVTQTPTYKNYSFSNKPDLKKHAELAQKVAAEGMVLLKNNNNVLPIEKGVKKIAAFGNYSYKLVPGGTGSGMVNNKYNVSVADGLTMSGYQLNAALKDQYTMYLKEAGLADVNADTLITAMKTPDKVLPEKRLDERLINIMATENDVALITIMRVFGEGGDRDLKESYELCSEERRLIQLVSTAFRAKGKEVVVVLNVGGIIEMASWQDLADAIVLPWQPGQEGGMAVSDVLSGKINPSGKLPVSIPVAYKDVPTANNFPGSPKEKPAKVVYEEGIFIGYRYYDTYKIKPLYSFGYGLSYTKFSYSNLKLNPVSDSGKFTINLTVRNSGNKAGKEVVQVYIAAPKGILVKPEKELKAFYKTDLLQPGESQEVVFQIEPSALASFYTKRSAWIAEKGVYQIKIGAASNDIRLTANYRLSKNILTEQVNPVLLPKTKITEFSGKLR